MTARRFRRQKEQERKKAERVAAKAGRKSLNTFIVSAALLAGAVTAYGFDASTWVPGTTVTTVSTTGAGVNYGIVGNTFAINGGDSTKSILNWNQLNVPTTKTLSFDGANTLYLNKVTGVSASTIAGTLTGTPSATVLVVNPNGVTISNGAVVNVGSLLLSTAPLSTPVFNPANAAALSTDLSAYAGSGGQSPIVIGGAVTTNSQLLLQGSTISGGTGVITTNEMIIDANGSVDVSNTANSIASLGNVTTQGGSFSLGNSTAVVQTGAISTGSGSIIINAGANNIILDNSNSVGGLITLTGGDIVINNSGAAETKFGEVVAANLSVDSGGKKISQNGTTSISVSGTTYLDAGTNVISLTSSDNEFTGSVNMAGGSISLTNEIATQLGTVSATSLNVTSGGAISQEAGTILDIAGSTTLAAGDNDVNIGNFNHLVGPVSIIGTATTVGNDTATVLGDFDVTALSVTSAGPISQALGTSLDVDGPASFDAGGSSVNLMSLNNEIVGPLSVTGGDVDIYNNGPTALGSVTAATFDLTSIGAVTQDPAAAMIVSGETEIEADGFAISLAGANQLSGPVILSGSDIAVNNTIATQLSDVLATGSFTLTSGGDVTQVANTTLEVTGDTTINAGPTNNIILDQKDNRFLDEVNLTGSVVTLNNSVATTFGNVTAGTLDVTSDGAIRQDLGTSITVAGETHLNAGDDSILLRGDNAFAGPITLTGGDVTLNNTIATQFGNVTAENLDVTSGGAITQTLTSIIHVDGTTSLDSGSAPITLRGDNEFEGTINLSGGAVSLNNLDDTIFGDVDVASLDITSGGDVTQASGTYLEVAGTTIIDAGSNSITLNGENELGTAGNAGDYIALAGSTIDLKNTIDTRLGNIDAETLSVRSGGDVTQRPGSEIDVAGPVSIDAGTNDITLSQQNDFNGVLTLTGGDVTVANTKQTIFGNVTADNLDVTSAGPVSQNAGTKLVVADDTTIRATAANVTLNNDNELGGLVSLTGGNVSLKNTLATELGDTAISGNFTLSSGGPVTQEDGTVISVAKVTTIDAGSSDIDLEGDNRFTGRLNLSGGAVDVNNTLATVLGDVDAASLDIDSGGAITQAALTKLEVTGASSFTADDGAANIVLGNDNLLGGPVALNGAAVTLNNEQATVIGNVTADSLVVTSDGAISQNPNTAITVATTASFTAGEPGALADITLDQENEFTGAVSLTGANVALTNDTATVLGAVDAASLTVNSEGAITQATGTAIDVAGAASFTAGTTGAREDITLDQDNEFYGPLALAGDDVFVNNSEPTQLAGVTADNFQLISEGSVTQVSGAMTVAETTSIDAGDGDITLLGANQLNGEVTLTGDAVKLNNTVATLFGNVSAESLQVTSGGDITQSAGTAISVSGDTSLNAGTGDIDLEEANTFAGQLALAGADVDIKNTVDTTLGNVSATIFDLTSDGNVTQAAGTAITAGATDIDTSAADGDIKLTNSGNTFGLINASAGTGNVFITETDSPMTVDSIVTSGDVTLRAIGAALSVEGTIGTDDQANINLVSTGDTSDILLGTDSSITGRNITVNSGRDIFAAGSIEGGAVDGLISMKADGGTGVIYGSNDVDKHMEAHAITLQAHTIGVEGATVETELDTDNIDDTFGLKLRLGKITSTSGVNLNNTGDATLSFRATEELEPQADSNNLIIEFLRNPLITKDTNYTIGNSLNLTPGNLSDPNIQSVTLTSLADRVITLEDALGDGFDANHTVAGYISRILNGTEGVFGLDGNTTSSMIASEYYDNPEALSLLGLTNSIALENTDELGQILDLTAQINAETTRATNAEADLQAQIGGGFSADNSVANQLGAESLRAQVAEQNLAANLDLKTLALQSNIDTVASNLTTETNARITGDNTLQTNIDAVASNLSTETGNRLVADTTLQAKIDAEAAIRLAADNTLQGNIDTVALNLSTERTDRIAADTTLQANIDAEAATRLAADNTLQGNVDTVAADLRAETTRATGVEGGLQTQIDNEVTRATGVEGTIAQNLADETTRAKGAEDSLQAQIGDGFSADNTVASAINTVANDLLAEQGRALDAEAGLQTQIDNEVTRATGVEGTIAQNLADETTRALGAEDLLQAQLGDGFSAENTVTGATNSLQAQIGSGFDSTHTVAGYVGRIINGTDGVNGLDGNTTSAITAQGFYDNPLTNLNRLQAGVDTIATNLDTEIGRAQTAEANLQTAVNTVADNLAQEYLRATGAEQTEYLRATGVEGDLQAQIGSGFSADNTIAGAISANAGAVAQEVTDRQTADTALQGNITGIQGNVATLQSDVSGLRTDVNANSASISGLQSDVTGLRTDVNTNITDINGLQSDVGSLQAALGSGFSADNTVASVTGGLRTDVNTNITDINGLQSDVGSLQAALGSGFSADNTVASVTGGLRTDVNTNITDINGLQSDVGALQAALGSGFSADNTVASVTGGLRTDVNTNITDINGLQSDVGSLQAALGSGFSAENTVAGAISGLRTDVDGLRTDVNANSSSITDLRGLITSLQSEDTNLQGQIDANGLDITDLKASITSLQTEDTNLQSQIDGNSSDITSLKGRVSTIESDLDSLADFSGSDPKLRNNVKIGSSGNTTVGDLDSIFDGQNATLANLDVTEKLTAGSISTDTSSITDIENRLSQIEGSVTNMGDSIGFKGFFTGLFKFFTGN